ncbi:hypothetical protein H5410_050134 [Solanum commersonii]|uniref:Uncharacterized protein n=1 Tax=Solanum commersonii TaxID=4109 RepID=A0A9J5WUH9_SOLCO|nr:hypothetical protein H5410_050134 [Solanum commersonii]
MAEKSKSKHLHDPIRIRNLPQVRNMNITNKRKIIGTSSTSNEVEKLDEDQIEEEQLLEHQTCMPNGLVGI